MIFKVSADGPNGNEVFHVQTEFPAEAIAIVADVVYNVYREDKELPEDDALDIFLTYRFQIAEAIKTLTTNDIKAPVYVRLF